MTLALRPSARLRCLVVKIAAAALAVSTLESFAQAQSHGPRGPSGGSAAVRTNAGEGGGSERTGRATPRDSQPPNAQSDGGQSGRDAGGRNTAGSPMAPPSARDRDNQSAAGEAMRRKPGRGPVLVTSGGYYAGGYYPWGYGGLGFGSWGPGYWDPWWPGEMPDEYAYVDVAVGSLRLKVQPREAAVHVDGNFAGHVDDFDGVFQRLHLETGPHRVELRLDGFELLAINVLILPDRTLTYEGVLKALP